jgi:hypothetical protein
LGGAKYATARLDRLIHHSHILSARWETPAEAGDDANRLVVLCP